MKNIKDILFIVQARTQSTRVPNKMLKPFANSNLFEIAIEKILTSTLISKDNFYLSIMDNELIDIAKKHNVNYFIRSEESTQEPVTLPKVFEWYNKLPFKYYVIINACNPLLKIETIDNFIQSFLTHDSGQFGVFKKDTFIFDNDHKMLNNFFGADKHLATLETKFVETFYEAAHSLYAGTMEDIGKEIYMGTFKERHNPEFYLMDENECFDIDWPWQFELAEKLYLNKK
jgi:CMP-N-acetylneuraminic acid synthetase